MTRKLADKTPTKRPNGNGNGRAAHLEAYQFKEGNKAAVGHGRPKTIGEVKELVQEIGEETFVIPKTNERISRLTAMFRVMFTSKSPEDRKTILRYGWGNPPQTIEITEMTDEQLINRARDLLDSLGFIDEMKTRGSTHADTD